MPEWPACRLSEDAVVKVKALNQKALAAYENLELEDARKALMEALQICAFHALKR